MFFSVKSSISPPSGDSPHPCDVSGSALSFSAQEMAACHTSCHDENWIFMNGWYAAVVCLMVNGVDDEWCSMVVDECLMNVWRMVNERLTNVEWMLNECLMMLYKWTLTNTSHSFALELSNGSTGRIPPPTEVQSKHKRGALDPFLMCHSWYP